MQVGIKFIGSSVLQTSTANEEIIPDKTILYKFSFMNDQDCTVKINKGSPIFLRSGQGFSMNEIDAFISSFVIVEPNITFNWIGGVR